MNHLFPHTLDDQGDSLSDNVTVQMSHPGIIIQTVTSEDLPDPLNQSGLTSEQDLANEEAAEASECSREGEEPSEQSTNIIQEDSTDKVRLSLTCIELQTVYRKVTNE